MLTQNEEVQLQHTSPVSASLHQSERCDLDDITFNQITPKPRQFRFERALSLEWLGQTVASMCWITSVFIYGISSAGDWLQLAAASAWLLANVASLLPTDDS